METSNQFKCKGPKGQAKPRKNEEGLDGWTWLVLTSAGLINVHFLLFLCRPSLRGGIGMDG